MRGRRQGLQLAVALLLLLVPSASFAAPAGGALLGSYAGDWRGRGVLQGKTSETVVCRLSLQPATANRFSYAGKCALAGEPLTLRGTLEYDETSKAFIARTNNRRFEGVRRGGGVVFTMSQKFRREGHSGTFSAGFSLTGGTIRIDFRIDDAATGLSTARVQLQKS